jgi:hypothetical protein
MLAGGLVLMVAWTNLANLLLARTAGRRQDTAVRLAMGASRARLLREQLVESARLAGITWLRTHGIPELGARTAAGCSGVHAI